MRPATATPTAVSERIGELDIIRGFALFGVLWINIFGQTEYIISADGLVHLWGETADRWLGLVSNWLMAGKAQALFSMLFGFGFAMMSDRLDARGAAAGRIYLRRVLILLGLGVAHMLLLWGGDILHAYALMGLVLMLTRRWPTRLLLALGLVLSVGATFAGEAWLAVITPEGQEPVVHVLTEAGMARRWDVFLGQDYGAYVRELIALAGPEFYASPLGYVFLGTILGRFLVGSWIYRQGWMQETARHAAGFRRALPVLLGAGLVLAGTGPAMEALQLEPVAGAEALPAAAELLGQLVLALGYGCGLVVLCQSDMWRRRLAGLGAAGQMALSNYLVQSVVFMLVLNGFGLGWLRYADAVASLGLAIVVFAVQVLFSRWWLARFRFGPAEWLWRWATYGHRPPLRRTTGMAGAPDRA